MAHAAKTSALADELMAAISGLPDKNSTRWRTLKRRVEDNFRSVAFARTDQFAVAKQLDGMQEKFQVLGRDDLADALRLRLDELTRQPGDSIWLPEVLSLLLQLSDRPAQFSRVEDLTAVGPSSELPTLSWSDLDAEGTAYSDEEIWESVDFAADTSDEDDDLPSISSSTGSIPRIVPQPPTAPEDDYVIPDNVFASGEDESLIDAIRQAQFWKDRNEASNTQNDDYSRHVTELQLIREAIFMLRGLPTAVFWRLDDVVEVDRRYTLSHSSHVALSPILRSFAQLGTRIDALRHFTRSPQAVPHMQTFQQGIEVCLAEFDRHLAEKQMQCLSPSTTTMSLLHLIDDVRVESRLLCSLSELISAIDGAVSASAVQCLDLLHDLVCVRQATGDEEEFRSLARLFFACLKTYLRPIRLWMEAGQLDPSAELFFISENRRDGDLRSLWHEWFLLDEDSMRLNVPKFLLSAAQRIFTAGKSLVFLRYLKFPLESIKSWGTISLTLDNLISQNVLECPSAVCLPFSGLLQSAFGEMVDSHLSTASALLRQRFDEQCGLWMSLCVLEHIYLCKDLSVFNPIDSRIFELMDDGRGAWNDRFLLTELVQTALSRIPSIDPSCLTVRSRGSQQLGVRSVKQLESISIDYSLPWPVANLISKNSMMVYQRVSTFLMQIRRAKYAIVKQQFHRSTSSWDLHQTSEDDILGYVVRHNLMWLLDVIYDHMTNLVISTATDSMRKALAAAGSVDDMVAAHREYVTTLQDQCLLSKALTPLHEATIDLLDLCIQFADIQVSLHASSHSANNNKMNNSSMITAEALDDGYDAVNHSRRLRRQRRSNRKPHSVNASANSSFLSMEEDSESDSSADFSERAHEQDAADVTIVSFAELSYARRLRNLKDSFDHLVPFLAAGFRSMSRVGGQAGWEILAEKLEWRSDRRRF